MTLNKPPEILRAFVIGNPVNHTKSPLIHAFWIKQHGIYATYEALKVEPSDLSHFMKDLKKGHFVGGNVTIPHKQKVMHSCDQLSRSATSIGAVNTLSISGGEITGSNSDHFGFVDNLDQQRPGWAHSLNKAIVLGAGGAARAIVHALVHRGIRRIIVLNRTLSHAEKIAKDFGPSVHADSLSQFAQNAPHTDLLVNTTSVGLNGSAFADLPLEMLPASALVHDIVYTPLLTPLLAQAQELGLETLDGLGMLLHQAIPGFERWFGVRPEVTPHLRAMIEERIPGL